jgi:hypothetical protein
MGRDQIGLDAYTSHLSVVWNRILGETSRRVPSAHPCLCFESDAQTT